MLGRRGIAGWIAALGAAFALGCAGEHGSPAPLDGSTAAPDPVEQARARLASFEARVRAATDFARAPSWAELSGPDPIAVVPLAAPPPGEAALAAGLLRGKGELVLLDASARELDRASAPSSPSALAASPAGELFVAGENGGLVARFTLRERALAPAAPLDLGPVLGIRALALGPEGVLYAAEELQDRVLAAPLDARGPIASSAPCRGPFRLERVGARLLVLCLIDHELAVLPVDARGAPAAEPEVRIRHDGPIWSFAAREQDGALFVALGGVEDHPLDRRDGFFGYVDSFVFVYRVAQGRAQRLATVNASALGVVTPKALAFASAEELFVTGFGGERAATLRFPRGYGEAPETRALSLPPGTAALAPLGQGRWLAANSLLDAWVAIDGETVRATRLDALAPMDEERRERRLGEVLVFTMLMAPDNPSEASHSRFSCETCHFEGYVDGRTHHTGRGDVHATSKPLYGLFNNKPHFSRALDPDLSRVAHAEFRVAGAGNGHDPWFPLALGERPWLAQHAGLDGAEVGPEELRRSVMRFLMAFQHQPNAVVAARLAAGNGSFDAREQRGAELFRARCASCHAPRLSADAPDSAQPFERWQSLVMSARGPIVWGSPEYRKTGVEPYVHAEGARTPSLRRLYKKRPYFTNGSAKTLAEVLERAAWQRDGFSHAGGPPDAERLAPDEREAIGAFLRLL